jgi:hypothetical protein
MNAMTAKSMVLKRMIDEHEGINLRQSLEAQAAFDQFRDVRPSRALDHRHWRSEPQFPASTESPGPVSSGVVLFALRRAGRCGTWRGANQGVNGRAAPRSVLGSAMYSAIRMIFISTAFAVYSSPRKAMSCDPDEQFGADLAFLPQLDDGRFGRRIQTDTDRQQQERRREQPAPAVPS